MAVETLTLPHGLQLGDKRHTEVELREPTAGDIIDASEEAERPVHTPDGWQLVASPTRVGVLMLGRQIVRLGELKGPIALDVLRKLHPEDFEALQAAADRLDAARQGAARRGRGDAGAA